MTEHRETADAGEGDIVESAGETTAAATGSTEIGAAAEDAKGGADAKNTRPVGADTMIKVEGEADSGTEG